MTQLDGHYFFPEVIFFPIGIFYNDSDILQQFPKCYFENRKIPGTYYKYEMFLHKIL